VPRRFDAVRDQLQAARRKLWILGARLSCLPAKIEIACRMNGLAPGADGPEQPWHLAKEMPASKLEMALCGSLDRWKLARLRLRANRAERRSATAIRRASASFSAALDSVLSAAVARAKADAACRDSCFASGALSGEERNAWDFLKPRRTSERNSS
jgi:hypothetical protein